MPSLNVVSSFAVFPATEEEIHPDAEAPATAAAPSPAVLKNDLLVVIVLSLIVKCASPAIAGGHVSPLLEGQDKHVGL
jgi:hypothetical protein